MAFSPSLKRKLISAAGAGASSASTDPVYIAQPSLMVNIGIAGTYCKCSYGDSFAVLSHPASGAPSVYLVDSGSKKSIATASVEKILAGYSASELALAFMETVRFESHELLIVHLPRHVLCFDGSASQSGPQWNILKTGLYDEVWRGIDLVWDGGAVKAVRRSLVDKLEDMQTIQIPAQSNSGLPEYRRAKAEQLKAQALEKNIASARELMSMLPRLGDAANQVIVATLVNPLLGHEVVPLPVLEEHYSTAGEVAQTLGCTANKIGRLANKHNLKTEQYGKFFLDKSKHSDKQVEAFRYNANGIEALRHLIHGADVA